MTPERHHYVNDGQVNSNPAQLVFDVTSVNDLPKLPPLWAASGNRKRLYRRYVLGADGAIKDLDDTSDNNGRLPSDVEDDADSTKDIALTVAGRMVRASKSSMASWL